MSVQILDGSGKPFRKNGKPDRAAFGGRALGGYQPGLGVYAFHPALREGFLQWQDIPAMLREPAVQLGLTALKSPLAAAEVEVVANSKEVQGYVESMLHQFKEHDLDRIADQYYTWGTCPAEVVWHTEEDRGLVAYRTLEEVYHIDCRVKHRGREVEAFAVAGAHFRGDWKGEWVTAPKLFWAAHRPPVRSPFGRSKLLGAWAPWMEKRGAKGAVDARRLWYFKYSFQGGIIYYPAGGTFTDEAGNTVSNEDYARELVEKAEMGFVMACPYVPGEGGQNQWSYESARINGSANDIREHVKDLDAEMWMGMGVPPEILRAGETGGGWSGRSVPLLTFLHAADSDVSTLYGAFDRGAIRQGVAVNFGASARYQVRPVSLVPKKPGGGGPAGTGQGQGQQQGDGQGPTAEGAPPQGTGQAPVQMSTAATDGPLQMAGQARRVGQEGRVPMPDALLDLILGGPVPALRTHAPQR